MKYTLTFFFLLIVTTLLGQQERIFIDVDRYNCFPGDTIHIKPYVFSQQRLSQLSTNLYVDFCTSDGRPIVRQLYPLFNGMSEGQIIVPDSLPTDNYFIVASTRNQFNYDSSSPCSVPILVFNRDKPKKIVHKVWRGGYTNIASGIIGDYLAITRWSQDSLYVNLLRDSTNTPPVTCVLPYYDSSGEGTVFKDDIAREAQFRVPMAPSRELAILTLMHDSAILGRQYLSRRSNVPVNVVVDTFDVGAFGYNSLKIILPDSGICYSSISVTDADRSSEAPQNIDILKCAYTEDLSRPAKAIDSTYITFKGKATREFGKKIKSKVPKELLIVAEKDTTYLFTHMYPIGENGSVNLDRLFFFGTIKMDFQINSTLPSEMKDIALHFEAARPPGIDVGFLADYWPDDTTAPLLHRDTLMTSGEQHVFDMKRVKLLAPAIVKRYKNPREELDKRYTSGVFSEPALYVFDLRNDSSEYNTDIFTYLNGKAGLTYDPVIGLLKAQDGHPLHFFVDQQMVSQTTLRGYDYRRIAYVKVLASDFLEADGGRMASFIQQQDSFTSGKPAMPTDIGARAAALSDAVRTPYNVCIYMRQGTDFRTMKGAGMPYVKVRGFDEMLPFKPNLTTLYWNPWAVGHEIRVNFNNTENCRRFRLRVNGVRTDGAVYTKEMVIE